MDTQAFPTLYEKMTADIGLTEREIRQYLPPLLSSVARAAGLSIAVKIAERFGGRKVYIPASAAVSECDLVHELGIETVDLIAAEIGGDQKVTFCNPFGSRFLLAQKGAKLLRAGWSVGDVAAYLKVSRTTVKAWKIRFGIPRHVSTSHPMRDKALQMASDGMSSVEIAELTGVHSSTIYKWRKQSRAST